VADKPSEQGAELAARDAAIVDAPSSTITAAPLVVVVI
jgi:hypothetical protein